MRVVPQQPVIRQVPAGRSAVDVPNLFVSFPIQSRDAATRADGQSPAVGRRSGWSGGCCAGSGEPGAEATGGGSSGRSRARLATKLAIQALASNAATTVTTRDLIGTVDIGGSPARHRAVYQSSARPPA